MPPILNLQWFNLSDGLNDFDIVLDFLKLLPSNLRTVFDHDSFIENINQDADHGISADLFFQSFDEAAEVLMTGISRLEKQRSADDQFEGYLKDRLTTIGYTGKSLQLKGSVLNKLWTNVTDAVANAGNGFIDFAIHPIVRTVRKFLVFLNSCLGSLLRVIPHADAIKEIKEVGESYLNIAD